MFNDDRRKNASFIFEKMKKVYPTFENPDEFSIGEWTGVLDGYSQTEILDAFKEYRKNVPYNSAPTPSAFKPFLHHKSEPEAQVPHTVAQAAKGDFAWERMAADIEAGCCRNALYVYRDAERIVLTDWLCQEMPRDIWARMNYSARYKQAMEKGLFNNFDEALRQAAQERFGRDFEFLSKNDFENQKNSGTGDVNAAIGSLVAHWGV